MKKSHPLAGIVLVIGACAFFSVLDTTTKYVSTAVPLLMALWARYAFQALATTAAVLPARGLRVLRTAHPKFQVLRGLLLLATSLFAFASLKHMPVGEFTAIIMIAPLVVTVMAATLLRERVRPVQWLLVAGGFVGTLIIIRPGGEAFHWAALLPLGLVVCNTWFQVLTSKLARTEDPVTMHLYTGWVGTLGATLALPFVWTSIEPSTWLLLGLMGTTGTIGHYFLILGYQRAPASTLTPYLYSQIGFAMIAGWIVFGHVPDGWSMLGMVMIAVCGAGGAWVAMQRSRAAALEPAKAQAQA